MTKQTERQLALRVTARPMDINDNGHIFGGWILSQMDIAGGIAASRRAGGAVATVAVDAMTFHKPMLIGDVISLYTEIRRVGRTSIAVHVDVIADRRNGEQLRVTEGLFTFVAIGPDARPRELDAGD